MTKDAVEISIRDVCKEIKEFIHTLYSHTDMEIERVEILKMLNDITQEVSQRKN